jgi:hypothetical protein
VHANERLFNICLARAIEEFDTNRLSARLIRRLSDECPRLFLPAALGRLLSGEQSNALRYIVTLTVRQRAVFEVLTAPETPRKSAIGLFRRFQEVDPSFDVRLAELLPYSGQTDPAEVLDIAHTIRALDLLDAESRGGRVLTIVGRLLSHHDTRVSAKATLFVGRRLQNLGWIRDQLDHHDHRIRANAVESMWGLNVPMAVRLLEDCTRDLNHRVSGNSLLGLHILGRKDVERHVFDLLDNGSFEFRSMAAWIMGRMGGPECFERLSMLVKDENPRMRSRALRSLLEMRRRTAENQLLLV